MIHKRTKFAKKVFAFMVPLTVFAFIMASLTFDGLIARITPYDIVKSLKNIIE